MPTELIWAIIVPILVGVISLVTAIWWDWGWEASDEPWRYNPEMTMVENGKAAREREQELERRKTQRAAFEARRNSEVHVVLRPDSPRNDREKN